MRGALERALRLERHDVRTAADGWAALALLAAVQHDAVVLDIGMPGVGLEVCRRLRAPGDRTPALMLAARDSQVLTRSQIFERGYDFGSTSNALGVYVGYLRRKTEPDGEPRLLHRS